MERTVAMLVLLALATPDVVSGPPRSTAPEDPRLERRLEPRIELRGLGVSMAPPPDVACRIELREDGRPRAFLARPVPSPAWTA
ncbi:MAG: hypothetical protein ACYTFH_01665, partial [Planctomycetota bacterium]